MLVLSRKLNERLLVDGGIEIKVLSVHGSRVKLGIEAPSHIAIRRGELELIDEDSTGCIPDAMDSTLTIEHQLLGA